MFMDYIFGPLDIKYCVYFNIRLFYGVFLIIILFFIILLYPSLLKNGNYITYFSYLIISFMIFFQNRLLYNMCKKQNGIMENFRIRNTTSFKNNRRNTRNFKSNARGSASEVNAKNAWNKQYKQLNANMNIIDRALKVIKENTKPLQYKTSKNIVNIGL